MNGKMERYHDDEWGTPVHDDIKQFEFLMMEVMQCGLSWNTVLQKREIFRKCFDGFDYTKIINYDEAKIESILASEGMIKSRRKVEAVINNAARFREIVDEFGSFSEYLWRYTDGRTICYMGHQKGLIPAKNGLSDRIAADLKKRGFKFLGSVTIYAHLQAAGLVNDHVEECFKYAYINENYPVVRKRRDNEG